MRRYILLLTVLSLVGAQQASAAVRYAAPDGVGPSGLNGCVEASPCGIEPAIEDPAVADGDEVRLLPGPYDIGGDTVVVDDAITIHPRDANTRPTISGSGQSVVQITDNATLSDVAIVDTTAVGSGFALSVDSNGALAERVTVKATNSGAGGQVACSALNGTIRDSACLVIHAGGAPFEVAAGSFSATGATTGSSRFINVTAAGTGTFYGLLASSNANDVHISITAHNVIAPSVHAQTGGGFPGATASISLTNSNYQNSTATDPGASATAVGAPTNQSATPLLVDPFNGDFRQLAGSPTIDAGAPASLLGTLDLDFEARSQGAAPDIGADEFTVPPTPTVTDTRPPETAIDAAPKRKVRTHKRKAKFQISFSADETSSFSCSFDGNPASPCASPFAGKAGTGSHVFQVAATDAAGNIDPSPATATWKVKRKKRHH